MTTYKEISSLMELNKVVGSNTFARTEGMPLDSSSVFKSYSELVEYAKNSGKAYEGQIVAVGGKDDGNSEVSVYVLDSSATDNLRIVGIPSDLANQFEALEDSIGDVANDVNTISTSYATRTVASQMSAYALQQAKTSASQMSAYALQQAALSASQMSAYALRQASANASKMSGYAFDEATSKASSMSAYALDQAKVYSNTISSKLSTQIGNLDVANSLTSGKILTSLTQTDGKIAYGSKNLELADVNTLTTVIDNTNLSIGNLCSEISGLAKSSGKEIEDLQDSLWGSLSTIANTYTAPSEMLFNDAVNAVFAIAKALQSKRKS